MIKITSKKHGFRRCGIVHTGTVLYSDNAFTPDIMARLKAEPLLIVEEGVTEESVAKESATEDGTTNELSHEQPLEPEAPAELVEAQPTKGKGKK